MPADLPPAYFAAERRFRKAKTADRKMEALAETLSILEGFRILPEGAMTSQALKKPPCLKKTLITANELDDSQFEEDHTSLLELSGIVLHCLGGSVRRGRNLTDLLKAYYEMADIVRVTTGALLPDAHVGISVA